MKDNNLAGVERLLVLIAFLLGAFLIFAGLGHLPLMIPDEGRNAEIAREMKLTGNWLVPTYNGLPYLDKPSFYFKTVALSFSLLGETETAARLSSALSGFILLVLTFLFVRREYGSRTGALAVMVVVTSPLFLAFSRLVIFDMMLALFVCGAIFAGYIAEQKQGHARTGWYALGAASSALATLVKGPVGFIIPGLVLGIYHAIDRRWGALKRFFAPLNLLVFFGLTLPWFFGLNHQHPDFAYYGLVEESFHRYTTTAFRRTGPFYYYGPWLVGGILTWSLLLPESVAAAWRARRQWKSADRLLIVWTIVVIVFFSISKSKRPDYIVSAIVALGALIARVLTTDNAAKLIRRGTMALAITCLAAAGFLIVVVVHPEVFGGVAKLANQSGDNVSAALTRLAVGLFLAAVAVAFVWWRRNVRASVAAFVGVPTLVFVVGFSAIELYGASKSGRALADQIATLPAGTEVAGLECFPTGLPFYRRQFVNVISENGDEFTSNYILFMLKRTKSWPAGVTPLHELERWLASRSGPVLLLARRNAVNDLSTIAAARGVTVTNLMAGWWGALLPAPGGK